MPFVQEHSTSEAPVRFLSGIRAEGGRTASLPDGYRVLRFPPRGFGVHSGIVLRQIEGTIGS